MIINEYDYLLTLNVVNYETLHGTGIGLTKWSVRN